MTTGVEMVAQVLKHAGKWTWCLERVVRVAVGGGGVVGGSVAFIALVMYIYHINRLSIANYALLIVICATMAV
jgi:threonine dehydratase